MSSIHTQRAATHCTTLHHTAPHCITLHHTAPHCTTRHHAAPHCTTLHHNATHCNTLQSQTVDTLAQHLLQFIHAAHCNTRQLSATHRNTLQSQAVNTIAQHLLQSQTWRAAYDSFLGAHYYTITVCNRRHSIQSPNTCYNSYTQRTATLCSTLQHTAPHCNTLQHTTIVDTRYYRPTLATITDMARSLLWLYYI